jgi:cell division septation protein DedD
MNLKSQKELARKAFYASIGAPVVAGRMAKDLADKLIAKGSDFGDMAQKRFEEFSVEGQKVTKQLRDADVVEEIQSRMDFDKVQDRVEKMRDQLEGALEAWRDSFTPAAKPVEVKKAPASKPATKKPATKAAAKPAAKKAPAKTTAAQTTAAKKPTTTRKAPAKTAAKK